MRETHILLETVQLHDPHGACVNLDFVALCGARPLGRGDLGVLESPGVAAAGFPAHSAGGESAFPGLAREVEVDVLEGLIVSGHVVCRCGGGGVIW